MGTTRNNNVIGLCCRGHDFGLSVADQNIINDEHQKQRKGEYDNHHCSVEVRLIGLAVLFNS
jgi:hypothetical protein